MPAQRLIAIIVLLFCVCAVQASDAVPLTLKGEMKQGAIVIGHTDPAADVRFAGREVQVSPEGVFVIGFDRDAPSSESLIIETAGGARVERTLEIARRDYNIQRIDGLARDKVTPPPAALKRIRHDVQLVRSARERDDARTDFLQSFQWPVVGAITGVYGSQRILNGEPRRPHYGIDIGAPAGTTVRAPAAGIVTVAEADMYFSGGTILLDHGHGLSSAFLHMRALDVEVGQRVEQGDPLGEVGSKGRSTGAHLDWRMNWFERRVDPTFLVGPMPEAN